MKNWKKIAAIAGVLALSAGALVGCGGGSSNSSNDSASTTPDESAVDVAVLKIGIVADDKPKGFIDVDGTAKGYDVEVFEEIDKLWEDVTFEFEGVDQSAMLLGVETGKYAIGTDGLFKNPSREEKFLFPDENIGWSPLAFVIRKDSTINSFEEVGDSKWVPIPPNWGNYYILSNYIKDNPELNLPELPTIDTATQVDMFKWIDAGTYDIYFGPPEAFGPIQEELNLNLKLSDTVYFEPTYPIFSKTDTDLSARYSETVKTLKDNGTLSEISEKWLGTDVWADAAAFTE